MSDFYDIDGQQIELMEWAKKFESPENKLVARTVLDDGITISTVWIGIDHQFGDGPPLIFETMVFHDEDDRPDEIDVLRYSTLEEAEQGHKNMVARWTVLEEAEQIVRDGP